MMKLSIPACALTLLTLGGNGAAVAADTQPQLATYQGCYKLAVSPWAPVRSKPYINPPAAIELTEVPTRQLDEGFVVKPALGAAGLRFGISYWNVTPDGTIRVEWTDGFSGITMTLRRRGLVLVGFVETFSDVEEIDAPLPKAEVQAEKVSCLAAR
jgi:hypothetical protein